MVKASDSNLEAKWSDFEKTGNAAVDMVADHIRFHRRSFKAIKKMVLSPNAYGMFLSWVRDNIGDDYKYGQVYKFDGVEIEKGTSLMVKDCYIEFFEMPKITA